MIFCYDANNTEKSWKGKPTTNNAANGKVDYYSRWATTTNHPPLPFDKKTDVYQLTEGNNYFGGSAEYSITNGNTYTVSYWYYISTTEVMQHFMLPLTSGYATAATENATNFVNTNNTNNVSGNINGWVWGYKTFTVTTAPTYMRGTYTTGGGDSTPTGKMYITNVMIEPGSTPSGPYGYTGSTRSNTQAILDLTNNNTITAQNVSYASDGTFSFDATDDYIDTGLDLSWNNTNSASIDFWCKPSTVSQTRGIIGKGLDWEWQVRQNGSNLGFVYWDTGGSHGNGPTPEVSSVFQANVWKNITVVWSHTANELYLYANGVLISTNTWTNASTNVNKSNSVKIGGSIYDWTGGGAYWSGSISNVKFYNLALSTQQVIQNFQALRGRYGV